MSFVSPEFGLLALLFFPLYWVLHAHPVLQKRLLLASSLGLYASWTPALTWVLLVFAAIVWLMGLLLQHESARKRCALVMACALCVSLLLFFKYYEFVREVTSSALLAMGLAVALPALDVIAPVGVSFFTFEAITYLVAVARREHPAHSFEDVLLFLSFWPTLFSGPLLRSSHFFAQTQKHAQTGTRPQAVERAIYLIMLGLFQKLVFAAWLGGTFVDPVFKAPSDFERLAVLCAVVGYSLQIFLDFAGYTSIVTGLALLLGFELPQNFAQPYGARNIQQFWTRWHMSLSSFIRDYLYIPLGGNRLGLTRTQINVMLAMLASGLWHGAAWTFLVWGALHGLAVMALNLYKALGLGPWPKWTGWAAHALTLLFVTLAWVFFRAPSLPVAFGVLAQLLMPVNTTMPLSMPDPLQMGALLVLLLGFMGLSKYAPQIESWCTTRLQHWPCAVQAILLSGVFYGLMGLSPSGVPGFIYYQF